MMEFYNNSFSNNYLNHKTFPDLDCEFSYSSVHDMEYSFSFSEFDYIKRVKKAMKNENLEKHFFEETKINKEKIIKNKSIYSFKNSGESFFKQKNIELPNKNSQADKTLKQTTSKINNIQTKNSIYKLDKSLDNDCIHKTKMDKEDISSFRNLNFLGRRVKSNLESSFDYIENSVTPKKRNSLSEAENLDKNSNDFCEGKKNINRNNYHVYDFEDLNNINKEIANELIYYCDNNFNRKKSEKGIFECFNSPNYENKENYKNLENYHYNKTDKIIKKNEFNYEQDKEKKNQNKINKNFNYIKTNLNEKIKSETNIYLVEKALRNQTKIKNEEKIFYSEAEIAKIEKILISKILKSRNNSINKIIKNYRIHRAAQIQKEERIIEEILQTRKISSILIQSAFRSFFIRKNINFILNKLKENYIFVYDYNKKYFQNPKCKSSKKSVELEEEPNHDIKLQLLGSGSKKSKNCEVLNFEYTKFLKCYMLVFKKKGLIRRNYKVNFIVNGNIIIDPRFKLDADEDGKFYNVIESHMLLIKNKIKSYENKLRYIALQNCRSQDTLGISTAFNSSNNTDGFYADYSNNFVNNGKDHAFIAQKKHFDNSFYSPNENNNQNFNKPSNNRNFNFSLQESKYWEDIFKIKFVNNNRYLNTNSVSDASESQGEVDRILTMKSCFGVVSKYKSKTPQTKSSMQIKPCLKKQSSNDSFEPLKKSVSFNENVQISFFSI